MTVKKITRQREKICVLKCMNREGMGYIIDDQMKVCVQDWSSTGVSWFSWHHPDSGYVLGSDTLVAHPFGRILCGKEVIGQLTHTSTLPAVQSTRKVHIIHEWYCEGWFRGPGLLTSITCQMSPGLPALHWKRWEDLSDLETRYNYVCTHTNVLYVLKQHTRSVLRRPYLWYHCSHPLSQKIASSSSLTSRPHPPQG